MNVIRSSPAVNLLVMTAVTALTFVRASLTEFPPETLCGTPSFLGSFIDSFQSAHPAAGSTIAALFYFMAAWIIGRAVRISELYFVKTTVTIPVYAVIACGIYLPHMSLTAATAALLTVQAMKYHYYSQRDGYGFTPLFFGSFCLGLLPMVYAPAAPMLLLMPFAVTIFKRSTRETIVALAGLVLPFAAAGYVNWGAGGEFFEPVNRIATAILAPSGYRIFGDMSLTSAVMFCWVLATVLSAVLFCGVNLYSLGSRPRSITLYNICAFIPAAATLALPGSTVASFGIVAAPAAALIPVMLIRLNWRIADVLYSILLLLCIIRIFIE